MEMIPINTFPRDGSWKRGFLMISAEDWMGIGVSGSFLSPARTWKKEKKNKIPDRGLVVLHAQPALAGVQQVRAA